MIKERELLPTIINELKEQHPHLESACEISSGFGVADVVFYKLKDDVLQSRRNNNIEPISSYDLVRVLTRLNQANGDQISLTFLREILPPSKKHEIISYLVEKEFILPNGDSQYKRGFAYEIGIEEVVAVEAKLSNWKRALYQAYRYKTYANKSYVALYTKHMKPALNSSEDFTRFNVGLIEVKDDGIVVHYEPKLQPLQSNVFSAWTFENLYSLQERISPSG